MTIGGSQKDLAVRRWTAEGNRWSFSDLELIVGGERMLRVEFFVSLRDNEVFWFVLMF